MKLPERVRVIVFALYERHKDLAHGDDDARRQLARKIAEQVRFELGPNWGHKSADPGRPPSKDAIAFKDGTIFVGWDLFNGATRVPFADPESIDLTGQHFIDVSPGVNHLGVSQPPVDSPVDGPPVAGCQCPDYRAELDAIRTRLEVVDRRIGELLNRPVATVSFPAYVGRLGLNLRLTPEKEP